MFLSKTKEQADQLREEVASGLDNIDETLLPGKLKLWCMQVRTTSFA